MKISMIGAGAMGGATVEGFIKADYFDNHHIIVSDPLGGCAQKVFPTGHPHHDGQRTSCQRG